VATGVLEQTTQDSESLMVPAAQLPAVDGVSDFDIKKPDLGQLIGSDPIKTAIPAPADSSVDTGAGVPSTTADPTLPASDATTKDVTPESTVQGQVENGSKKEGVLRD